MTADERKGLNETRFRDVNERLERRALERAGRDRLFEILCECDDEDCTVRITITVEEYETVRADPRAFVVVPGHEDPSCERVIVGAPTHVVVAKFGEAGAVAVAEDPR